MSATSTDHAAFVPQALARVREQTPLVQCLINVVVTNFTANVLYAVGGQPAMVDIPDEAGPLAAGGASGVVINLGTPYAEQRTAMIEAAQAANSAGTPWVLDPVAIGRLPVRTALAQQLLELRPPMIRGKPSGIAVLAGAGADGSADSVEAAAESARTLARRTGGVVAVSGPVDFVTDGERESRIANGDAMITQVTGGGCALAGVMAAFAAVDEDRFATTVAALAAYSVAAELAARQATGPGSFAVAFVDALAALTERDLLQRVSIS
ncbi:hydroxyethylthiazole kinase [Asanoa sp. NPDC049573]|uniref:hydroxyethylthiazole kinase n=1 Tax=Asanoa sp. NPDC049573 TaxID=3155396 RepID=UPI00341AA37E